MYAVYTHRSGRVAEIEYVANDDCRQIDTRQRYTLILLEAGSLTLDVGGHIRAFAAPCVLPVQENLEITFVRSHRLAARVIRFDVSFLNVHIGYEMIHSGRYDESIEDFGFIPLNAFYECPDGVPPFLPLSRDGYWNWCTGATRRLLAKGRRVSTSRPRMCGFLCCWSIFTAIMRKACPWTPCPNISTLTRRA